MSRWHYFGSQGLMHTMVAFDLVRDLDGSNW